MPDAVTSPRRNSRPVRELSADAARAKILGKLEKAGRKGTGALFPPSTKEFDRATYARVLEELEEAEEVFADRRPGKPKYFIWSARPEWPTAATVAQELALAATQLFPLLSSVADFKKRLGRDREKAAYLAAAITLLVEQKQLVVLVQRAGQKETTLYVAADGLRQVLGAAASDAKDIALAYQTVTRHTGFPAVLLSELLRESRVELPELHRWLVAQHQAGRAVLSLGDWSLATPAQQAVALELNGERYLQVRLLA